MAPGLSETGPRGVLGAIHSAGRQSVRFRNDCPTEPRARGLHPVMLQKQNARRGVP